MMWLQLIHAGLDANCVKRQEVGMKSNDLGLLMEAGKVPDSVCRFQVKLCQKSKKTRNIF